MTKLSDLGPPIPGTRHDGAPAHEEDNFYACDICGQPAGPGRRPQGVYDRVCREQGLTAGCPEAAELAAVAMDLFARGIFEEDALLRELRR